MKLDFHAIDKRQASTNKEQLTLACYKPINGDGLECLSVGNEYEIVKEHLGEIRQNQIQNFWTFGRYAMHDVLKYVLLQVGPSDVEACTWAISTSSVETLLNLRDKGYLKSFKLWIDPRVKVRNPQPLQMLQLNFPITISPVHAKVTLVSNPDWKISISGSLNFTTNPQPERGIITTIPSVFDADMTIIERHFSMSTTLPSAPTAPGTYDNVADESELMDCMSVSEPTRKAWRMSDTYTSPKCNMIEKIKYHQRKEFSLISAFERSEDGYELTQIKSDFYNVGRFADSVTKIIEKLIGGANRDMYALVIPPKRRHTVKNFAEETAKVIAERTHLHFYQDAVSATSKQRINAVFTLNTTITEPIVIIFDDIITTGSTLRSTGALFQDKSVMYVVGIYNS